MISQKKCVPNCHNPAPSFLLVTRQSHFYHLNTTFMLMYMFMLLFKGCRVWTFSILLGREDTQGRGPPSCYDLHELLQASPAQASVLPETLILLVLQGQSKCIFITKIMPVFPPALPKLCYTSRRSLGTLPLCSHCIPSLHFRCSFSIKLSLHFLEFSILSLAL